MFEMGNVLNIKKSLLSIWQFKKLTEISDSDPVLLDGVTYYVKYLGSTLIEKSGPVESATATKTVLQMAKSNGKKILVGLTVSCRGISILDTNSGEIINQISIYDIAHCSTDGNFPNVFAFIATNKNDVNECFCFASRKRKMAKEVTLTIAGAFNLAFEIWQNSIEDVDPVLKNSPLIVNVNNSSKNTKMTSQWVNFDDDDNGENDEIETLNENLSNLKMNSLNRRQNSLSDQEDLLICFD